MTDDELLAHVRDGGRYEVRVVDSARVALLILFEADVAIAVAKLTDEQARHLGTLLVQASERLAPAGPN